MSFVALNGDVIVLIFTVGLRSHHLLEQLVELSHLLMVEGLMGVFDPGEPYSSLL